VGTKLVSAFAIGYPTEPDNFYIAGETLFDAPLISCLIRGAGGEFLFGLESNKLTVDSPGGYRQLGSQERPGLRIQDDTGRDVLAIETLEGEEVEEVVRSLAEQLGEEELALSDIDESALKATKITRIYGEFFDKHRELAARGDATGLSLNCPAKFG
jgi:hypothetical protein